jgi:hypothetical protein
MIFYIFLFLFGFADLFQITTPFGRLPLYELMAFPVVFYSWFRGEYNGFSRRENYYFFVGCFVLVLAHFASGFFTGASNFDVIKYGARAGFFYFLFLSLSYLIRGRVSNLIIILIGLMLGRLLRVYYVDGGGEDIWKFEMAGVVTLLGVCLFSYIRSRGWAILGILGLLGLSALNLALSVRSLAFIILIAVGSLVGIFIHKKIGGRGGRWGLSLCLILASLIAFSSGYYTYRVLASSGALGDNAYNKYIGQTASGEGAFWVLLQGRSEWRVYIEGVKKNPIFGTGPGVFDPELLSFWLDSLDAGYNRQLYQDSLAAGIVPTHSILFGAWVEVGVLGALVWLFVVIFLAKKIFEGLDSIYVGLIIYVAVESVWHIMFSPFGTPNRLGLGINMAALSLLGFTASRKSNSIFVSGRGRR